MTMLLEDLRFAARRLFRSPGFTAAGVITLALAMAASVAIFTVVNAVLLRPLPYRDPDRIVEIRHYAPGMNLPELGVSPGLAEFYRERSTTLKPIAVAAEGQRTLTGSGKPQRVRVEVTSPEIFSVLGTPPRLGRAFSASDAERGAPPVAILLDATWQSRFGADASVIGRTVEIDGITTEIVGVMPPDFRFPGAEADLLLPLRMVATGGFGDFGNNRALARLAPGVNLKSAQRQLKALQRQIPERFSEISQKELEGAGWDVSLETVRHRMVSEVEATLWLLFATTGLVLLIAVANVANLFLVRAEARSREFAVRTALGASRSQISLGFLTESLLLGVIAGAAAVPLAIGAVRFLILRGPVDLPRFQEVSVDASVLAFAGVLSMLAGISTGALALPTLLRHHAATVLRSSGRGSTAGRTSQRTRRLLIVAQVCLAYVLLVAAGLMLRSVSRLNDVDPGFQPAGVMAFDVSLGPMDGGASAAIFRRLLDELAGTPGVVSVGATSGLPLKPAAMGGGSLEIASHPLAPGAVPPTAMWQTVMDGYFSTLRVPLLAGRAPERADVEQARPVAWVNETFARRFLANRVVGERIRLNSDSIWVEVVGVVGDVRAFGLSEDVQPTAFLPLNPNLGSTSEVMQFVIRSNDRAGNLTAAVRAALDRIAPDVPITAARYMDDLVASSAAKTSFAMLLFLLAAAVAFILSIVGLYGVVSHIVSLRTPEIGVRLSLGAQSAAVRAMILREGFGIAVGGILLGLVVSGALMRLLSSILFGVSAHDPLTLAVAAALLTAVSVLAAYLPARRASRMDPLKAMSAV